MQLKKRGAKGRVRAARHCTAARLAEMSVGENRLLFKNFKNTHGRAPSTYTINSISTRTWGYEHNSFGPLLLREAYISK